MKAKKESTSEIERLYQSSYSRVASSIGSRDVAVEILEALWLDARPQNFSVVLLVYSLQGVRESPQPGEGFRVGQILEKHSAFVLITAKKTRLASTWKIM